MNDRTRKALAAAEHLAARTAYVSPARAATLWWAHSGPTPRSYTAGVTTAALVILAFPLGLIPAAALWLLLFEIAAVAGIVHEFAEDDNVHCRLCHRHDGGGGRPDGQPEPTGGPLDPFTADEVHMLEFQYRTQATR